MNEASRWRFALAEGVGAAYAANPKVKAVMVAGSTGRGSADRFSDLEIDVYWSEPPSIEDRQSAVARAGGSLLSLDEDPDEWEEQMDLGGFHAATSAFLVETMERYLREALEEHSTSENAQMRLYSLLHAQPLSGHELIERWRQRAANYPHGLALAVLRENLQFHGFGYAEDMLAARDDLIMLYDVFLRVERQILRSLLGLNRIYLPNPGFKSMDELIGELRIKPADLAARLKQAFHLPASEGVRLLHEMIDEVFTLVETHVPELDLSEFKERVSRRRGAWDNLPHG